MKKYKFLLITAFLGMLLSSCISNDSDKNIEKISDTTEIKNEDSKNLITDLPIIIDNTDFIVFSIRDNKIQERKRGSYDSENWYNNYLDNLIFQHIKTQETYILTKKKVKIISYERLIDTLNPSVNATVYQVIDSFPKNNKHNTFTALYLSKNDGKYFTKITNENEHLNSWKYIPETKNIYFITNDDMDNNRKLNNSDRQTIHSVSTNDFGRTDLLVETLASLNH